MVRGQSDNKGTDGEKEKEKEEEEQRHTPKRLITTPDGRIILAIMIVFGALMYHTASASYNSLQIANTQQKVADLNNYVIKVVRNSTQQQRFLIKDLTEDIKNVVHNDTRNAIQNLTSDVKPASITRAELLNNQAKIIQLLSQIKSDINNLTKGIK